MNYEVKKIPCKEAKAYIIANHYSHGCHNGPSPCYGLFDNDRLIGVLMYATPCSENVRASVFGPDMKDSVVELHRLHILDETPKNAESYFISRTLKLLKVDRPKTKAVLSFSDLTEGHEGTIYKASNFMSVGSTNRSTFYIDQNGRLRHPRQNGTNISKDKAIEFGWTPVKRASKNRYLYIIWGSRKEKKELFKKCKLLINN